MLGTVLERYGEQRRAVFIEPDARVVAAAADERPDLGAQHLIANRDKLLAAAEIVAIENAYGPARQRVDRGPIAGDAEVRVDRECAVDLGHGLLGAYQRFINASGASEQPNVIYWIILKTEIGA